MPQANITSIDGLTNLTASQQRIWLGQQLAADAPLYNMVMLFEIDGHVDLARFQQAFDDVIFGCDALQTVLTICRRDSPKQTTPANPPLGPVQIVDLSKKADVEGELTAWVNVRSRNLFQPDQPLFDSVLLKLADDHFAWYLNMHHVIADVWAMAVVYRRCSDSYMQMECSEKPTDSPPQFRDFVAFERGSRGTPQFERARKVWETRTAQLPVPRALYGRHLRSDSTRTKRVLSRWVRGDRSNWRSLQRIPVSDLLPMT